MDKVQPISEAIVQLKWNEIAELSMQGFAIAECVYIQRPQPDKGNRA